MESKYETRVNMQKTVQLFINGNPAFVNIEDKEKYLARGYTEQPTVKKAPVQKSSVSPRIEEKKKTIKKEEKKVKRILDPVKNGKKKIHEYVFEKMNKEQLLAYAKQQKLKGVRSDMKRDFIIRKIKKEKGIK